MGIKKLTSARQQPWASYRWQATRRGAREGCLMRSFGPCSAYTVCSRTWLPAPRVRNPNGAREHGTRRISPGAQRGRGVDRYVLDAWTGRRTRDGAGAPRPCIRRPADRPFHSRGRGPRHGLRGPPRVSGLGTTRDARQSRRHAVGSVMRSRSRNEVDLTEARVVAPSVPLLLV